MNKTVKVLSTAALAATLVVPVAAPAFAANYSVPSGVTASPGNISDLGRVLVEFNTADITSGDSLTVRLPGDFKITKENNGSLPADRSVSVATGTSTLVSTKDANGNTVAGLEIDVPGVENGLSDAAGGAFDVKVLSENEVKLTFKTTSPSITSSKKNAYFYLNFKNIEVPGGYSGDVKVELTANNGSKMFSNKSDLVLATVGSGKVSSSVDSVKSITTSQSKVDNIRLKEDRPGAFAKDQTVKYKLPNGFKWKKATVEVLEGDITAPAVDLTGDDGRTLKLTSTSNSTKASTIRLKDVEIEVDDETAAKTGDVVATISGSATNATSEITVAKYGDYGIKVYAVGDPKTVVAGTDNKIGKFAIEESIGNSLQKDRTITMTLVGKAKWMKSSDFTYDASESKNYSSTILDPSKGAIIGNSGDVYRLTVGGTTSVNSAMKAVFKDAKIYVSPEAEGDIKVVFGGTAGVTGELVLAKAVKPVKASIEGELPKVVIGEQAQQLGDIIVAETGDGNISADKAAVKSGFAFESSTGKYYRDLDQNSSFDSGRDYYVSESEAKDAVGNNRLALEFPIGVVPTVPTSVTVTEGDLVLNNNSVQRYYGQNGHWYVSVDVKSTSSKASKVKFSGIKVTTDRTVPEGPMSVKVGGTAVVQTLDQFPGATSVDSVDVAQVVTPAAGKGTVSTAVFKLNSKTFTVDGKEVEMDAQPLVKWDRAYVPVRFAANALGVADENILWDDKTQTVTIFKDGKVVQMTVGKKEYSVNGVKVAMDAPVLRNKAETNNRTMLPLRYIANALNVPVDWNKETGEITLGEKK